MNNYVKQSVICPNCQHKVGMVIDKNQSSQQVYDDCPSCHRALEMKMVVDPHTNAIVLSIDSSEDGLF